MLQDRIKIIPRHFVEDERGWFLKVITGTEENIPSHTGEVYLTMGTKGQAKGGHYHPKAIEWFTVIEGKAMLKLEDVETHEKMEVVMSLENPISVFVPTNVAHIFENLSDSNFIVLAYTDLAYNPSDTIIYQL